MIFGREIVFADFTAGNYQITLLTCRTASAGGVISRQHRDEGVCLTRGLIENKKSPAVPLQPGSGVKKL
ncbi:MAG TPA: hypothetical protein DEA22_01560 [Blastocatellia bacterium]|nr:hypothetical protein [Blastocatellia bacterium]